VNAIAMTNRSNSVPILVKSDGRALHR
jgi:hypothetical protein